MHPQPLIRFLSGQRDFRLATAEFATTTKSAAAKTSADTAIKSSFPIPRR